MMGYSYPAIGAPSMCFNGHKNWLLGWYQDKSTGIDILAQKSWSGRLHAFVDYDRIASDSNVLIKVNDLYLQYNRARRFNSGTQERGNEVTIVRGPGDNARSGLLGGVALGIRDAKPTHRVNNFQR